MIITRIRLYPFAGLNDSEYFFARGMNVLLGPNEAGKSTIFHAAKHALFTPAALTKPRFRKEMQRFLPIGDGDIARVELDFEHGGGQYTLTKQWGSVREAEIGLPGGAALADENAIAQLIESCTGASRATFKAVLMTRQNGLSETIEKLRKNAEAMTGLGDILRKTLFETDGVSIDKFKGKVEALYDDYSKRWDWDRMYPEKGRGIENPYRTTVGLVAKVFYEKEAARVAYERAVESEQELDRLNGEIGELGKKYKETGRFLKENRKFLDDARERELLTAKLASLEKEKKEYIEANRDWPVLEHRKKEIEGAVPKLEKELKELEKAKREAEKTGKNRAAVDKWHRVKPLRERLDKAKKRLESAVVITGKDLGKIRGAFSELNDLKSRLRAGKVTVRFTSKKDAVLKLETPSEKKRSKLFGGGEPAVIEAEGTIRIGHPNWDLEVIPGDPEFVEIERKCGEAGRYLDRILAEHSVKTLEEAEKANLNYEECARELKIVESDLRTELGRQTYADLEKEVRKIGALDDVKIPADVAEKFFKTGYEFSEKKKELAECERRIRRYRDEFRDMNDLSLRLARAAADEKALREKIAGLAPLPEGIDDLDGFVQYYRKIDAENRYLNETLHELEIQRARFDERMPGQSSEELEKRLEELDADYQRIVRKGGAIAKIRELTARLVEEMETDTFGGIREDVEKYIARITDNRYRMVRMEHSLPSGFFREDGNTLGLESLSTGAADMLGLALRLSMGRYFLDGRDGFLMMDDPLVDLDPGRRKKAAEILKEFALEKQLIIFTCHPSSAELLGGDSVLRM